MLEATNCATEPAFLSALVPGAFGLVGVLVGGWITTWSQKRERVGSRIREQLDGFYSPLYGMRQKMVAQSLVRQKVSGASDLAWRKLAEGTEKAKLQALFEQRFPDFEKVIAENNRKLIEEILPLYRKMVDHFAAHMGLAEPSTRPYFPALVEWIEIWDGWLKNILPPEVVKELGHSEDPLRPFYRDLEVQLDRLREELKR